MKGSTSVVDSDVAELKNLASALLVAETPELGVLDQIATLAGEIAARLRETARQQLLDHLATGAQTLLPAAESDLPSRLAHAPLDQLSRLGELLDQAVSAQTAFARADSDLMAARERGDYAAMAPLALEADTQKIALATASAEFANRIALSEASAAETAPAASGGEPHSEAMAATDASPPVSLNEPSAVPGADNGPEADVSPVLAAPEAPTVNVVDLDLRPTSQAERRRIRDLIRQMRSPDDGP